MSKQMYETDDNTQNKKPFWRWNAKKEDSAEESPLTPWADQEETVRISVGSGDDRHGMGKKNPFENWQIRQTFEKQPEVSSKVEIPDFSRFFSSVWRLLSTVVLAALIVASLFSLWTPGSAIPKTVQEQVSMAVASEQGQTLLQEGLPDGFPVNRIGIVVGHRGYDSGAVCANGLTELEINSNVATYLQQYLIKDGFEAVLLDEYDPQLKNYQAALLLSIHSDSCDYINDNASGFKVAAALNTTTNQDSTRLVECLSDRYAKKTGLRYHYQSVTTDMTSYHVFDEINPFTSAAIIELGFMNLDQEILTTKPDLLAEGLAEGIGCYMNSAEEALP